MFNAIKFLKAVNSWHLTSLNFDLKCLAIPKTTLGGIFTRIKKKVKFCIFTSSFLHFRDFRVSQKSFLSLFRQFRETAKLAKIVPHFRETRTSFRSQFREIFAKRNFVKNPNCWSPHHCKKILWLFLFINYGFLPQQST